MLGRMLPLLLAALLPAACAPAPGPTGPAGGRASASVAAAPRAGKLSEPPHIVLVSIDTLRREHLGCYGYFRDTSPQLDAWRRRDCCSSACSRPWPPPCPRTSAC
jgi:hypothetical protein